MRVFAFSAALLLLAFEFQNLLAWWRGRTLSVAEHSTDDYTIVVPLYGDPRYFSARASLSALRARVLVCCEVSSALMAAFADELERDGFTVLRITDRCPNSASLMRRGVAAVTTTYALRLDADTLIDARIANAVRAFADSGADLASVRVEAAPTCTLAGRLQTLEYRIAMLARRYRPWMTSGACFIGRTEALVRMFDHHSLWSPGEDIETGRVALALRMVIRHVDYVAYTEVPERWRALFAQRLLWWAGNYRHFIVNFDRNVLQLPVLTFYYMLGAWVGVYFHVWSSLSVGTLVALLPALLILYLAVTVVCNLQVLSPWMLIFPLYTLAQTTVMPTLGAVTYARLAYRRRNLGRYRFGWMRRAMR
jgi:cellulose synthase/poly-beta-1,6-N-acetylglucosamine synthase-like glycosyltransferase